MLYLTPEVECQNCRHLTTMTTVRERKQQSDMARIWRNPLHDTSLFDSQSAEAIEENEQS